MNERPMLFHIYHKKCGNRPLCWDGTALEFATRFDAERFVKHTPSLKDDPDVEITKDILYYKGGHLDATGKIPYYIDGELEKLVEAI